MTITNNREPSRMLHGQIIVLLTLAFLLTRPVMAQQEPDSGKIAGARTKTGGDAPDGLYCYNFTLDTSPFNLQPSGAMNMSRFTNVEFEFTTISPPFDPYAQVLTICDDSGEVIGINKPTWRVFDYNFDLFVFEERLNMVTFVGGNAALMYAT